jgi:hypothetical protein
VIARNERALGLRMMAGHGALARWSHAMTTGGALARRSRMVATGTGAAQSRGGRQSQKLEQNFTDHENLSKI